MNTSEHPGDTRTFDLEILQSVRSPDAGFQRVGLSVANKTPAAVSGVKKLVQRYTLIFLSAAGDPSRPFSAMGTTFVHDVLRGARRTSEFLMHSFVFANGDTIRQLRNADDVHPDTPDDERINAAVLEDIRIARATMTLSVIVRISSLAGTSAQFSIPVEYPRIRSAL